MGSSHCQGSQTQSERRFIQPSYLLCLHSTASSVNLFKFFVSPHALAVSRKNHSTSTCVKMFGISIFSLQLHFLSLPLVEFVVKTLVSSESFLFINIYLWPKPRLSSTGWRGEEWITKLCCDQTKSAVGEWASEGGEGGGIELEMFNIWCWPGNMRDWIITWTLATRTERGFQ